jgi:hypothetical protein
MALKPTPLTLDQHTYAVLRGFERQRGPLDAYIHSYFRAHPKIFSRIENQYFLSLFLCAGETKLPPFYLIQALLHFVGVCLWPEIAQVRFSETSSWTPDLERTIGLRHQSYCS